MALDRLTKVHFHLPGCQRRENGAWGIRSPGWGITWLIVKQVHDAIWRHYASNEFRIYLTLSTLNMLMAWYFQYFGYQQAWHKTRWSLIISHLWMTKLKFMIANVTCAARRLTFGAWQHFKNDEQSIQWNNICVMASSTMGNSTVCPTDYSDQQQSKHNSSTSLSFVGTICHRWFLLTNGSVMRESSLILWQLLNTLWRNMAT